MGVKAGRGQLTFDQVRKACGHGGWRPGAGRPKLKGSVSHRPRARFSKHMPQHVTMRLDANAPSIASRWLMARVIRPAIRASQKPWFRVVEFNVLGNHMHMIVEASGSDELARGVQGLAVRLARNTNSALNRTGKLFGQRYHARSLKTPTEVRNALRYVLLNRKHHAAEKQFERGSIRSPARSGSPAGSARSSTTSRPSRGRQPSRKHGCCRKAGIARVDYSTTTTGPLLKQNTKYQKKSIHARVRRVTTVDNRG